MPPSREQFVNQLRVLLRDASSSGASSIDVRAGDLHREVGDYPGRANRMPTCCDVMYAEMGRQDTVVASPPKGRGASLVIRYVLPRASGAPVAAPRTSSRSLPPAVQKPDERSRSAAMPAGGGEVASAERVVLVSCVKRKRSEPAPARDLYISPLFRGMRAYAESVGSAWFILSAEHGVLRPDEVVAPYERTLSHMTRAQREAWAARARDQLASCLPSGVPVTILAGARYREAIASFLRARGHTVIVPMHGLAMGQQLQWLSAFTRERQ